jgi:hypothetical protein
MKKTIVKNKLVLRKETTKVLLDRELGHVGAGQGNDIVTQIGATCVGDAKPHAR